MKYVCNNCGEVVESDVTLGDVTCPKCGHKFDVEIGKEMLKKTYKSTYALANKAVYTNQNYDEGIKKFKECLNMKENDFGSIAGIILATIYGQSLDDLKFKEVKNIIEEYDIDLDSENTFILLNLINDILDQVDLFDHVVKTRFVNKNLEFYNTKYLNFYKDGLKDILDLIDYFLEALKISDENEMKEFGELDSSENAEEDGYFKGNKVEKRLNQYKITIGELYNKEYKVIENEAIIHELRIIPRNEKALKAMGFIKIGAGALVLTSLVLLILGIVLQNSAFYGYMFIPLLVAAIVYFVTKLLVNRRRD